jgi:glucose-1-phosphate thymidylyltransferase
MRGIVMAGGNGSRLWPVTMATNKHLLNIYDKPLIHYPIATLMAAGIRDLLLITKQEDIESFTKLLGNGGDLGLKISYKVQDSPGGIAQAFTLGEEFIGDQNVALILGDNIFHGSGLGRKLSMYNNLKGAQIFAYPVSDPGRYGVVEFDSNSGKVLSIEEKPLIPKSTYAIPGLYFYDNRVCSIAKGLKPSNRGELEITDINKVYLESNSLCVEVLPRGTAWLDTGTVSSLHDASTYIRILEDRQGRKVACLEELAWRLGWISDEQLILNSKKYANSSYGVYLMSLLNLKELRDD